MDSSLVRLDAGSGRLTGQRRLQDRRLGLRHLALFRGSTAGSTGQSAMNAGMKIGIALQAEHDDADARRSAPVLATWDRAGGLRPVPLPAGIALAGYGGSIAALEDGFAVTCPKAGKVARWRLSAGGPHWRDAPELPEACAVAAGWIAGVGTVLRTVGTRPPQRWQLAASLRLDNHWAAAGVGRSGVAGAGADHG